LKRSGRPFRGLLALATLLAVAVVGCGGSPTSPLATGGGTTSPSAGPPVLKVNADGSVTFVTIPPALRSGSVYRPYDGSLFDPSRALTVSESVDGALGGRLVCGRFVATVPPGAFVGVGTITMSLPDSTLMLCDLEVAPAELNDFLVPVDLSLHTSGTDADLDSLEIYWWDPEASAWTSMGCQRDVLEPVLQDEVLSLEPVEGVRLQVNHFSRYAAGKAGW
jgi:hypothetical protein